MPKKTKYSHSIKVGQIPGTLIYTGKKADKSFHVECFDYNSNTLEESIIYNLENIAHHKNTATITWININGLKHIDKIENIGQIYELHPLVLEDIVNIKQRPKIDEYPHYLFIVLKMLYYENTNLVSEQVSFILGENYVLTFQEAEGDVFNPIRDRLRQNKGRIRTLKSDYLLYSLIDAVVDNYYTTIEVLSDTIEDLETRLFNGSNIQNINTEIQKLKREVLKVRRAIFPLREIINRLEKGENKLIYNSTLTYFRDIYDHLIQVTESIEIYREMVWSLMDMYMSTMSHKMNEVMKVLTIIATIFIPLTFIAGVYGMNFKYMPELQYRYGYFILWGLMVFLFFGLLYYFKRKKWL